MDYGYEEGGECVRHVFRSFVCVALTLLIGLHAYAYVWGPQDMEGGFGEVKYVVMQLTRGLSEASTYLLSHLIYLVIVLESTKKALSYETPFGTPYLNNLLSDLAHILTS